MQLRVRRVYEPAEKDDGYRVLIDRLWPRGLKKEDAAIDLWLKDAAPSTELRRWFGHDPERWDEFQERYRQELAGNGDALSPVLEKLRAGEPLTLLYSAHDERHNNALVLQEALQKRL